jgi:hypothetical protein
MGLNRSFIHRNHSTYGDCQTFPLKLTLMLSHTWQGTKKVISLLVSTNTYPCLKHSVWRAKHLTHVSKHKCFLKETRTSNEQLANGLLRNASESYARSDVFSVVLTSPARCMSALIECATRYEIYIQVRALTKFCGRMNNLKVKNNSNACRRYPITSTLDSITNKTHEITWCWLCKQ